MTQPLTIFPWHTSAAGLSEKPPMQRMTANGCDRIGFFCRCQVWREKISQSVSAGDEIADGDVFSF
jgi:hypothetical protein